MRACERASVRACVRACVRLSVCKPGVEIENKE